MFGVAKMISEETEKQFIARHKTKLIDGLMKAEHNRLKMETERIKRFAKTECLRRERFAKWKEAQDTVKRENKPKKESQQESETSDEQKLAEDWEKYILKQLEINPGVENCQKLIQRRESLEVARRVSKQFNFKPSESRQGAKNVTEKALLLSILISKYPNEMMPNPNELEQSLVDSSIKLNLELDTAIAMKLKDDQMDSVSQAWQEYLETFQKWQAFDRPLLLDALMNEFVEYSKVVRNIENDSASVEEWIPEIETHQSNVVKKIFEICGTTGVEMLRDEVEKFNQTLLNYDVKIEVDSKSKIFASRWMKRENSKSKEIDAGTVETQKQIADSENIRLLHELMLQKGDVKFDQILGYQDKSMQEIKARNSEILDYIKKIIQPGSEYDDTTKRAIFGNVFDNMKQMLMDIAPANNQRVMNEISSLNCDLSTSELLDSVIDGYTVLLFHLSRMCAPARDPLCREADNGLKELKEGGGDPISTIISVTEKLLELLYLTKADLAEFKMKMLYNKLKSSGTVKDYELEHFATAFPQAPKTIRWLNRLVGSEVSCQSRELDEVIMDAILSLIFESESELPETFYLDTFRLKNIRHRVKEVSTASGLSSHVKNFLMANQSFKDQQFSTLIQEFTNSSAENFEQATLSVGMKIREEYPSIAKNKRDIFSKQLNTVALTGIEDPVAKVFLTRIRSLVRDKILGKFVVNSRLLSSKGFEDQILQRRLGGILDEIEALYKYNVQIFGETYQQMIKSSQ